MYVICTQMIDGNADVYEVYLKNDGCYTGFINDSALMVYHDREVAKNLLVVGEYIRKIRLNPILEEIV